VRVPLLDLTRQPERVREAVQTRVRAVFSSQQFILGKTVEEFEEAFRRFIGCDHVVGMSSGTDAEIAILMAMEIGPGDAVITTPYTFFRRRAGFIDAEPVFAA
jgi:dTDP-4-amino-4,6-dideoxygalactose transaminase